MVTGTSDAFKSFDASAYQALFEESLYTEERCDLLPEAFLLLKQATLTANSFLSEGKPRYYSIKKDAAQRCYQKASRSLLRLLFEEGMRWDHPYKEGIHYSFSITDNRLTQHHLLLCQGEGDFHNPLRVAIEKTKTEPSDVIPRLCELMMRHQPLSSSTIRSLRDRFFTKHTKKLFEESPEYAKIVFSTFQKLIKSAMASRDRSQALALLEIEIGLRPFINDIKGIEGCREELLAILKDSPDYLIATVLSIYCYSLPDNLADLPVEKREEALHYLVRTRFHPEMAKDIVFYDRFLRYGPEIDRWLQNEETRVKIIPQLFADRKIQTGGAQSVYKDGAIQSGKYMFCLRRGQFLAQKDGQYERENGTLRNLATSLLSRITFAEDLLQVKEDLFIADQGRITLQALPNHKEFSVTRQIDGVHYTLIQGEIPKEMLWIHMKEPMEARQLWLEVTSAKEKRLLVKTANFLEPLLFYVNETNEIIKAVTENEELEWVDPKKAASSLRSLSRFFSSEKVHCWKKPSDNHIRLIQLDETRYIEIEPGMEGLQARYFDGESFHILSQRTTHEALDGVPSYLLIEGAGGEKEVLIPEGSQWISALLGRGYGLLGLHPSLLRPAEEIVKNLFLEETNKCCYKFRITKEGNLDSQDPIALAYLLLVYLLQGQKKKAGLVLDRFLAEARLQRVDTKVMKLLLPLTLIPPDFEGISDTRQKILAALEENRLLFPSKEKNDAGAKTSPWIEFLFLANVVIDLKKLQEIPEAFRKVTQKEEYFLFHFLFERISLLLKEQIDKDIYPHLNMELLFELFQISPALSARFRTLRGHFGHKEGWKETTVRILSATSQGENFLPEFTGLSMPEMHNHLDFTPWKKLIKEQLIQRKFTFNNLPELINEMSSVKNEKPPLSYKEISSKEIKTHFLSYYAICRGETPSDQKEAFSKILPLLKGSFTGDVQILIHYLEAVLQAPRFCPTSSTLQNLLERKNPRSLLAFFNELHETCALKKTIHNIFDTAAGIYSKVIINNAIQDQFKDAIPTIGFMERMLFHTASYGIQAYQKAFPKKVEETPLAEHISKCQVTHLDQADAAFDALMDSLFSIAFEEKWIGKNTQNAKSFTIKAKTEGASQQERIQRVNKSHSDFQMRKGKELVFCFLGEEKLSPLLLSLKTTQNNLRAFLKQREEQLLAIIRPSYLPKKDRLTLGDLHEAMVKGTLAKVGRKLQMGEKELDDLEALFMHYVVLQGRFEQVNRAARHLDIIAEASAKKETEKVKDHLEKLAIELKERRAYSFQTIPRKLAYFFAFFEWMTKTILFSKQTEAITKLFSEEKENVVQELLMSFGKTFFGIPTIDAMEADGEQIVFNIFPSPLAATCTQDISKRNEKAFKQKVLGFSMDRFSARGPEHYQALNIALQSARSEKEVFSSTKTDLQALELNFLDHCLLESRKKTSRGEAALKSLQQSLRTIRERGKVVGDEAHHLFNQREELNYPVGAKKSLDKKFILTIERTIRALLQDPLLTDLICENQLGDMDPDHYIKIIVPKIANKLASMKEFGFDLEERLLLELYLSGKTPNIPEFLTKHPQFEEICLMRGVLLKLFKNVLCQNVNINFGRSKHDPLSENIKPYHGNNNPLENCSILSPYEDLVKTYLTYLHQGFSLNQVDFLLQLLRASGEREKERRKISIEETQAYKLFKRWAPDCDLTQEIPTETKEKLRVNQEALFLYIRKRVATNIHYWERALRSNPQNFASMVYALYFDSGTPHNDGVFHPSLKMLWDPGTIGEALHLISAKCPEDGIHTLKAEKPEAILDETIDTYFIKRNDFSLLIDGGALLTGISNEVVVDKMIHALKTNRPDIRAVVYAKKVKGEDLLVYRDIATGKDSPFSQCNLPKEQYVTYLDQIHSVGTNVPQSGSAIDLVGSQPLFSLLQEAFRLRALKEFLRLYLDRNFSQIAKEGSTQTIHFAMTEKTARKVAPKTEKLTLEALINYVTDIEAKQAAFDNYQSYVQKVHDIVRRAILDKMIFAPSISKMLEIFIAFLDFLIPKIDFTPSRLFGWIEKEEKTDLVLDKLRTQMTHVFASSNYFTESEKEDLRERMRDLPRPPMPDSIKVFTNGQEIDFQLNDTVGLEATLEQNSEEENELNQEKESSLQHRSQKIYEEAPWPIFNPRSLEFLNLNFKENPLFGLVRKGLAMIQRKRLNTMPSLYRVSDHLKNSTLESLRRLAPFVDPRLWFSEHFLPPERVGDLPCEFGSKHQCDLFEIVVHYSKSEAGHLQIHKVGCLTQKEAKQWKQALTQSDENKGMGVMIYDVFGREAVAGDAQDCVELKATSDFQQIEAQLRYLARETDYPKELRKPLKGWLGQFTPSLLTASFSDLGREKKTERGVITDIDRILSKLLHQPIEEAI